MKSSVVSGENRGSVNEILLKALQSGDKYGYEINKEIETKSGGKFFLKEASLYSGLKRLQSAGFITSYWQDGELGIRRHYYSITQKGLDKLNSSNFTWDSSKEFLGEIFKDAGEKSDNNALQTQNENLTLTAPTQTTTNAQTANNIHEEKKNPFQIEVNPLQQSFFDFDGSQSTEIKNAENFSTKPTNDEEINIKNEEIVQPQSSFDAEKSDENLLQSLQKNDEKETENATILGENNAFINANNFAKSESNNNNENSEKIEDKNQSSSYDELIKNYEINNYSSSLQKENVIDIASLLASNTQINDSSIVFEKPKTDSVISENFENIEENKLQDSNQKNTTLTNQTTENLTVQNNVENKPQNGQNSFEAESKSMPQQPCSENVSVDFKNIFGSLLADNNQSPDEQTNENNNKEVPILQNLIEEEKKPELPRINVDNDVNVMLKSDKKPTYSYDYTANNIQNRNYEDKIVHNNSNSASVKQYIDNVHKQTLISRATTVSEEVNLEGINIREYSKMNNKLIRNSNYIYSNKLSMFLALLFAGLIIIESVLSFIFLNKFNSLGTFEIILFSCSILFAITICFVYVRKFVKEKFKVELKNYSFKTNMFYFALIFVVCLVLAVCINIFSGMNINNSGEFYIKLIFEAILLSNVLIYPVVKLIFFKMRCFTN